jgi:hypothetical protein
MDLSLEWSCDVGAQVRVTRREGSEIPVRLRLLGYDGCEFESDEDFVPGEKVAIHIYRMGLIRARIVRCTQTVVEAEFDKHCPV